MDKKHSDKRKRQIKKIKIKISEIKILIFKTNECYFYVLFVLFTILNQRPLKYSE